MQLSVCHTIISVVGAWDRWYSAVRVDLQGMLNGSFGATKLLDTVGKSS